MEFKKLKDGRVEIWEEGRKTNKCYFDSETGLKTKRRKIISLVEKLLRDNNEIKLANKIKEHLGKIITFSDIPELIPTGTYRVNTRLSYLKKTIDDFIEEFDLNLDPDFQRCHVWSREQQVKFVEFILQGGKCPPIYFNHTRWMYIGESKDEEEMVIVDGKQRLTALLMFLNNEFYVFKNLDKENNIGYLAKHFNELTRDIEMVVNDLPTKEKVLEWYLQINKGQVAHTDEEISKVEIMLNKIKEEIK